MRPPIRIIPVGYKLYAEHEGLYVIYADVSGHRPKAIAYKGKASKASWHVWFTSQESLDKKVKDFTDGVYSWEEHKKERRAERADQLKDVKVGDMFSSSWGYDQTNVDFYQVVKKKGKTMVIRRIARKMHGQAPSGGMSDYVSPVKDAIIVTEPPITKRTLSMDFGLLRPTTEDKKHFCSWYH